ncbi:zinc-ribbon domain-containing protein [Curtobacterium citreum]
MLAGFNDLATTHPAVAAEWHSEDAGLGPTEVTAGSGLVVQWLCSDGHSWPAPVSRRALAGSGCPSCTTAHTSAAEQRLVQALDSWLTDVRPGARLDDVRMGRNHRATVDALGAFQGRRVAIEYDGAFWHKSEAAVERDIRKTRLLSEAGFVVVRVRTNDLGLLPSQPGLVQVGFKQPTGSESRTAAAYKELSSAIESALISYLRAPHRGS